MLLPDKGTRNQEVTQLEMGGLVRRGLDGGEEQGAVRQGTRGQGNNGAGNEGTREQGTREQGTGSREQGIGSREQRLEWGTWPRILRLVAARLA